ncbi:hypothetical protein Tco_1282864 [Tanacetum coccineum]
MANNHFQALPLANNNEVAKQRKREDNLRTWKWNEVIDVDALPDKVEIKTEETTVEPQVVASENINVINLTLQESQKTDNDEIRMANLFKRRKKDQIKITGRTRLCRLFDEDSSDQEEFYDEESSDLEEYLGLFDESDQEEDLGEDDSDQDDSDDGWV